MTFKSILILFIFVISAFAKAQTLSGTILTEDQVPLPFVNVLLNDLSGNLVKATISNENGNFTIQNLKKGDYMIKCTFLGFQTTEQSLKLQESLELAPIVMTPSLETLDNVTIVAEKPIIQVEPDKTVFNVAATINSAGNNGLEVLRKAPGVRLDNNNNVIVEGKAGVLIYIDGRQSYLQGDDLTAFLESLQADTIESIEIITQPSAKYDAAGNAGIINIKLKREKGLGTRGNASNTVTIGDYARTNNQISLTTRLKKWNVYGTYSNFYGRSTGFINLFRVQGDKIFDAQNDSEYDSFNNNVRIGTDFYLSNQSTLGAVITTNFRDFETRSNNRTPIIDRSSNQIDSILQAPNRSENNTVNFNTNLNYRYEDTTGMRISADVDYGRYTRERFNFQPNVYILPSGTVLAENITQQNTPITIDIFASKFDYEQQLGTGTLETGAKFSKVITDNNFEFFNVIASEPQLNTDRSNEFKYDETIYALYAKYAVAFEKFKMQGGLRLEMTDSQGDLTTQNAQADESVNRNYTNYFPSAGITYQAAERHSLALNYSRRIQRPNYQDLNPFEYQLDELSFRRGNPFLQPQYTDNIKLAHTYKYTLTTSVSYSYVSDFFAQVTEAIGTNRNFISTRNVADQEIYNLSISYPFKINDWWRAYANVYGSHNQFKATNPAFLSIDQTTFGFYAQNTFSLPGDYAVEVSGWYNSPSIWGGTYEIQSLGALNIGIQKKWERWTAKVTVNDVLYTIPWRGTTQFGNLFIDGSGGSDSRNLNVYLSYTFGRNDVQQAKNRGGSLEDEQNRID